MPQQNLGRIGLIGLGMVGSHYADHLLKAASQLSVHDTNEERVHLVAEKGAVPAASPLEVANKSDIIVLSLPSPEVVEEVMLGANGLLKGAGKEALVIDSSTIDPEFCDRIYRAAREHGVSYLEAPMSGGAPDGAGTRGAEAATVTFMVGGDKSGYERAKPVLEVLGERSFYLGPAGSGATVKLISNHIAGLNMLVTAEAFTLGAAAGFSYETLLEVFAATDANNFTMFESFAPRVRQRDFEPGFSVDLMHKDHRLAGELAERLGVPMLFNQLALETYQILRSRGLGQKDFAEAANLFGELADVDIYNPRRRGNGG